MCDRFLRLFGIVTDPETQSGGHVGGEPLDQQIAVVIKPSNMKDLHKLPDELTCVSQSEEDDTFSWRLEPSREFSTGSLYREIFKSAINGASLEVSGKPRYRQRLRYFSRK